MSTDCSARRISVCALVVAVLAVLVPGAYAADTFEPNDTRQTAAALPFGVALSSYLFTSHDEDWYRVVTPRAGHLRVRLDVPDGVDYSLSISDFSGYYIDVSNLGSGLDEEVWLTSRAYDSFFVRVSSSGDHSEVQPYTLSTTLSFSDDTYEDNGNPQDGRRIAPGTYRSKVHSISDTDCFRFELWAAGTFSVTLDVPPSADLRLDLYSVSGDFATLVEASVNDGAGVDESITRPVTGPGKFYLVVTGDDASTFEEYALTLTGGTIRAPHAVRDDFDRYGGAGLAVYGTVTGVWHIRNQSDVQFGQPGDIPVAGDYNGDNVADIAVYRPSTGTWYVRDQLAVQFGEPGDIPVPADYNGDLYTDIAVYRPSTGFWYVRNQLAVQYRQPRRRADSRRLRRRRRRRRGRLQAFDRVLARPGSVHRAVRPASGRSRTGRLQRRRPRRRGGLSRVHWPVGRARSVLRNPRRPRLPPGRARLRRRRRHGPRRLRAVYRQVGIRSRGVELFGQAGDVPVARDVFTVNRAVSDFNGDGMTDVSVYWRDTGHWLVNRNFAVQYGDGDDRPVPADYDRDGLADIAVYRPSTGMWYVRDQFGIQFGDPGDVPIPGDYDGDGRADVAVYRPSTGTWFVRNRFAVQFGDPGDIPVPGDYNGDGVTDVAVYRPSTGRWYVRNQLALQFGDPGDLPIPGDYDGDGRMDIAVFRPSTATWFVRGQFTVAFGQSGDVPVPGDYDGDGVTDPALYRPADGRWEVRNQFSLIFVGPDAEPLVQIPGSR